MIFTHMVFFKFFAGAGGAPVVGSVLRTNFIAIPIKIGL